MGSRADQSSKPNLALGPHLAGTVKVTNLDNKVFFFQLRMEVCLCA